MIEENSLLGVNEYFTSITITVSKDLNGDFYASSRTLTIDDGTITEDVEVEYTDPEAIDGIRYTCVKILESLNIIEGNMP